MAFNLEATGEYPFTFYIEKAVATEDERDLVIEGVASTTNIDHDNERMSKEALATMANIINEKSVPLRVEHSKSENAIIGKVTKAWVDERNQLHIRAVLDKSHPVSPILHHSMKELGKKMGFSVGGLVKRAVREFSEAAGRIVKTFYDVELKEVSVTPRPANYDSWAVSKSIAKDAEEAEAMRGTFYDEFLFENPQLDYLLAFAKSVPEEAWRKVNKTGMDTENDTKTKATETADTEKAVTRGEFGAVVKAIETMGKAFNALVSKMTDGGAMDQNNPNQVKPEDESPAAKSETAADETKEKMSEEAHDQNAPDKAKPTDESPAAKSETAVDETKEKASDSKDTYDMETVTRATKAMQDLTKRIQGMKKAEGDEETATKTGDDATETAAKTGDEDETAAKAEEDETATKMSQIDQYVLAVSKAMEAVVGRLEKSGKNVLGFEKSVVDSIINDPEAQSAIKDMLKLPGFKKSVAMGVPYMVTKTGKRYALTATEVGASTVEKSRELGDEKPSFKSLYKAQFSSIREGEGE